LWCTVTKATLLLGLAGEKVVGEPKVQQYLWHGSKKNDMQVPRSTLSQGMINTRRQQWRQQHMQPSQYTSTYKVREP
jgi:hypothetical protein